MKNVEHSTAQAQAQALVLPRVQPPLIMPLACTILFICVNPNAPIRAHRHTLTHALTQKNISPARSSQKRDVKVPDDDKCRQGQANSRIRRLALNYMQVRLAKSLFAGPSLVDVLYISCMPSLTLANPNPTLTRMVTATPSLILGGFEIGRGGHAALQRAWEAFLFSKNVFVFQN